MLDQVKGLRGHVTEPMRFSFVIDDFMASIYNNTFGRLHKSEFKIGDFNSINKESIPFLPHMDMNADDLTNVKRANFYFEGPSTTFLQLNNPLIIAFLAEKHSIEYYGQLFEHLKEQDFAQALKDYAIGEGSISVTDTGSISLHNTFSKKFKNVRIGDVNRGNLPSVHWGNFDDTLGTRLLYQYEFF